MFGSMKNRVDNPAGDIETIIGKGTTVSGAIQGAGNVRIDGRVESGVSFSGDVVIGESGVVEGPISARNLTIGGDVKGNVCCSENLTIQASGQLVGDVRAKSLNIIDGGVFSGRSDMAVHEKKTVAAAPALSAGT